MSTITLPRPIRAPSRARRRRLLWVYLALVAGGIVIGAAAGWHYYRLPRLAAGKRVVNDSIELPLMPPSAEPWLAENAFPRLRFAEPVLVTFAADGSDRLYVLERRGTIQTIQNDSQASAKTVLLDISDRVISTEDGDNGALGLAFHPQFGQEGSPQRGFFYVLYTAKAGRQRYNRLSRFTLADGQSNADPASERVLIDQLDENEWHDGGPLCFGPDGFLYLGMGDEGYADDYYENGQKIDKDLFAGVLRIDVDCRGGNVSHPIRRQPATGKTAHYYIPNDNPFLGSAGLEEFWALGLRNPYRMSFDRVSGELWAGDVGQNAREEICLITRGSNHQWSYAEGSVPFAKSYLRGRQPQQLVGVETRPVFEYPHLNANYCVIGGYVYRGQRFPELVGKYLYGDNVSGRVWALDYDREQAHVVSNVELVDLPVSSKSGLSSFGEDRHGELYLCVLGTHKGEDGTILKLAKNTGDAIDNLPRLLSQTGIFADLELLTPKPGVIPYDVNSPLWSDGASKRRWMMIPGDGSDPDSSHDRIAFSPTGAWKFPVGTVFIKHFELPLHESQPEITRRLETRLLVCDALGGVYGCTYKWNEAGDDAELLTGGWKETYEIQRSGGGIRSQTWTFPSRADCLACHTHNAGYVLGVKTSQLNGSFCYPSTKKTENQLQALSEAAFFDPRLEKHEFAELPKLASIRDAQASVENRVRSYLDANCANCHRPGGVRANFDARFETRLELQNLIGGTLQKDLGMADARFVRPREAGKSMLVLRMIDAQHKMPPLGASERDLEAIDTFCQWIDALPQPPDRAQSIPDSTFTENSSGP